MENISQSLQLFTYSKLYHCTSNASRYMGSTLHDQLIWWCCQNTTVQGKGKWVNTNSAALCSMARAKEIILPLPFGCGAQDVQELSFQANKLSTKCRYECLYNRNYCRASYAIVVSGFEKFIYCFIFFFIKTLFYMFLYKHYLIT